jgi:hypothetical protein
VISHESPAGPGFHGRAGYMASWRPIFVGGGAIRIAGSPFKTFNEAEAACDAMLKHLMAKVDANANKLSSTRRITTDRWLRLWGWSYGQKPAASRLSPGDGSVRVSRRAGDRPDLLPICRRQT